jgi:hypothetical protein
MDDMIAAQAQNEMQEELFRAEEPPPVPAVEPEESGEDWKTNEARQHVAQKIEEKLYPDIHINGDAAVEAASLQAPPTAPVADAPAAPGDQAKAATTEATPEQVPQPGADAAMAAVPERPQPEAGTTDQTTPTEPQVEEVPEVPQAQDDWKAYEVREEKQDWSGYIVPRSDTAQQREKGTKADKEVEEALSGLTEMSEGSDTGEQEQAAAPQAPKKASPKGGPDASTSTQGGVEQSPKTPGTDQEAESKWSMEQLRRNLTNLDQDEGN